MADHVATARTDISASPARVWAAMTDPARISKFMFGSEVSTDWQPGSPVTWAGEYAGKTFQDKGEILEVEPEHRLTLTHFSPMSGLPDVPENYHTVRYTLTDRGDRTEVALSQDNNPTAEAADHSAGNWQLMLDSLKEVVEHG